MVDIFLLTCAIEDRNRSGASPYIVSNVCVRRGNIVVIGFFIILGSAHLHLAGYRSRVSTGCIFSFRFQQQPVEIALLYFDQPLLYSLLSLSLFSWLFGSMTVLVRRNSLWVLRFCSVFSSYQDQLGNLSLDVISSQ